MADWESLYRSARSAHVHPRREGGTPCKSWAGTGNHTSLAERRLAVKGGFNLRHLAQEQDIHILTDRKHDEGLALVRQSSMSPMLGKDAAQFLHLLVAAVIAATYTFQLYVEDMFQFVFPIHSNSREVCTWSSFATWASNCVW